MTLRDTVEVVFVVAVVVGLVWQTARWWQLANRARVITRRDPALGVDQHTAARQATLQAIQPADAIVIAARNGRPWRQPARKGFQQHSDRAATVPPVLQKKGSR